jgi:hypothetical protein
MNIRIAVALAAFLTAPAWAQQSPPALDLKLPAATQVTPPDAVGGADTPGTYYGDVDGKDGKPAEVHGSFTTGIGYSKEFGNSTFNSADLDVSKQYDSGRTVDMHLHVEQSKGFPYGGTAYPYGYGYGSRYRGY